MQGSSDELLKAGRALRIEGDYAQAEPLVRAALAADPSFAKAHHELALILNFTGMFDESIAAFQEAIRLQPGFEQAHLDLGKACTMLGMYDEAKAEFQTVLNLNPNNDDAQRQLQIFKDMGF